MPKPVFLSLDGLDGTGKSTQCRLLVDWLTAQKVPVTACVEPGGTAIGQELRNLVLFGREHRLAVTTEAMLFMASRAQLVDEVIRPALDRGEVVVSDRFTLANVVYQGHAGGIDPEKLWQVGSFATRGIEPDLTFVLDLPVGAAMSRASVPAPEFWDASIQARARTGFLFEAGRKPDRYRLVDAAAEPGIIHQTICREVIRLLAERGWQIEND
jgi:dTMP kinase